MRKLLVRYCGWGENWPLARLADDGRLLLFEYGEEALHAKLELSPIGLPLRAEAYGDFPAYLLRLPGLIADSLPDGWGLMLMDRYVRRKGREPATLSPLDRLALVGARGLGALTDGANDCRGRPGSGARRYASGARQRRGERRSRSSSGGSSRFDRYRA
jgi:serine/threonine-protein kinase HipA